MNSKINNGSHWKKAALIPALFALAFSMQCAGASAGITAANMPMEGRKFHVLGTAETTVSWWSFDLGIIGVPLGRPPVDEAERILLEEKGGDALINLRYFTDRTIILLLTRHRFYLKADVVQFDKE